MDPEIMAQFHEFMVEGKFTDVNFEIENDFSLRAHKIILAAYSPVFRAMFETDMLEAKTNRVILSDVNATDFQAFLDFLYTKNVKYLENRVIQMYTLADKYNVQCLQVACDEFIVESLVEGRLSNAILISYLVLMDNFNRVTTKKMITQYIRKNLHSFMTGDEWKILFDHPSLSKEVFKDVRAEHGKVTGSEAKWSASVDWIQLKRISQKENFVILNGDGNGAPKHLVRGNAQVNVSLDFESFDGRVHVKLDAEKIIPTKENMCLLSIESQVKLKKRTFSNNKTTIKLSTSGSSTLDLVVFEHNQLTFTEPVTILVRANLFPPTQVTNKSEFKPNVMQYTRFTDAVILVKKCRYPVHKVLLASKSKYFQELFEKDSEEYQLDVKDLSARSFELLLDFIYNGRHPDYETEINSMELLIGAYKLQLQEVVDKCIPFIDANINCDNVVNFLIRSDALGIKPLKTAALSFLIQNKEAVDILGGLISPELFKEVLLMITDKIKGS